MGVENTNEIKKTSEVQESGQEKGIEAVTADDIENIDEENVNPKELDEEKSKTSEAVDADDIENIDEEDVNSKELNEEEKTKNAEGVNGEEIENIDEEPPPEENKETEKDPEKVSAFDKIKEGVADKFKEMISNNKGMGDFLMTHADKVVKVIELIATLSDLGKAGGAAKDAVQQPEVPQKPEYEMRQEATQDFSLDSYLEEKGLKISDSDGEGETSKFEKILEGASEFIESLAGYGEDSGPDDKAQHLAESTEEMKEKNSKLGETEFEEVRLPRKKRPDEE